MIKKFSSQKGAAVVEFAALALLLMIFIFGIIEFGMLWLQSNYVGNAAREGARVAAKISGTESADVDDRRDAASNAVREYLREFFLYGDKVDTDFLAVAVSENNLVVDPPVTPVPRVVGVTVTVKSAEIYRPVLWPLLNLVPGLDSFPDNFLESLTQSADFVILAE